MTQQTAIAADDVMPPSTIAHRLDGKVALVTGAGRGLGRACAIALAEAGAEVIAMSRTATEVDGLATMLRGRGLRARALACDVKDRAAVRAAVAGLDRLDILVNNAGNNVPQPFVEVTDEALDHLVDLNVRAAFVVAQAAARRMTAQGGGGAVVHMSSTMGHIGGPNRTVYCMTKHAIEGLTKAMAVELAPLGIRVNSVAPTFVETSMTRPFFENAKFMDSVLQSIPMGRIVSVWEVAAAVVYLASPAAGMVTGISLLVDGGWTAR